jgi:hypothetical protein
LFKISTTLYFPALRCVAYTPFYFNSNMAAIEVPAGEVDALWKSAGSDLKFLFDRENVEKDVQSKFYYIGVLTVNHFAAFADDKTELKKVLKDNFNLDPSANIVTRVNVGKIVVAWSSARARATKLADAEGEAEARNIPKDVTTAAYHAMRATFEDRYWDLSDRELPGRSYVEKKLDEIEKGELRAEFLSEVISREEDEPDSMRTVWGVGGELKAMKVTAKVPLPSDTEMLRHRIILLGTAWMFTSSHQTSRGSLAGITPQLFQQYLQYLLGEFVLGMINKGPAGNIIHSPAWHLLISYEYAVRAKAIQLMRRGASFRDALKQGWECPMTRERHFSTPLAMDTVSRRPEPLVQHRPQPPQPPSAKRAKTLALTNGDGKGKGSGKKGSKNGNGEGKGSKNSAKLSGYKGARKDRESGKPLCFAFNMNEACPTDPCLYMHACGGCFKHNVAMINCPKCKTGH